MVDHYCVAPWRMEQLEIAEKERDEMKRNLTDKEIQYYADGCCTDNECNTGRLVLGDEVVRLRDEIKRLRSELAVSSKIPNEIIEWLKRVPAECSTLKYLVEENQRLTAELARYTTPNVDNIEVINERS